MEEEASVTVVLEAAALETAKLRGEFHLLSSELHAQHLMKNGEEVNKFRPDITHHCLLNLLDSPLNKAGRLQIFIHTEKNVLIRLSPSLRIPRTYSRFAGIMCQLLHSRKIKGTGTNEILMKVIKNPITAHLAPGSIKIGTDVKGELTDINSLAESLTTSNVKSPIVFFIGAVPHGNPCENLDFTDQWVSISNYPLTAATVCSKITAAFEQVWKVI